MTTYAVIGTGGVGGYYGIRLAGAGSFVHFLIRSCDDPERPLVLESPDGPVRVRPGVQCAVHRDIADVPPVDVVLVAVKATANEQVLPVLAGLVRPGGAVMLLQNGIDAEPRFASALPADVELAGGLAFLASHRASPSRFVHVDYGALTLGRYLAGYVPAPPGRWMRQLAHDLHRAAVPVVLEDDLLRARWQKLVWNVPFNGLSVVLGATTDAIVGSPSARRVAADLMAEVLAAAAGDGRPLPEDLIGRMLAMTDAMRPYAPSMMLDFEHGRTMEIDAMHRAAVARAGRAGVPMPRTAMLADVLSFLQSRAGS